MAQTTAPVAIRGFDFRLRRELGPAGGWAVEELGDDRVVGVTTFRPGEFRRAIDCLDEAYLARLAAGDGDAALEVALRWGLAHRRGDLDALAALMADGSALYDHRRLGIGDVPREQLLALLGARWETNSVALVAEYARSGARGVVARVVYVGHADEEVIDDSVSYTVFELDGAGVIARMDVYDDEASALARHAEIS